MSVLLSDENNSQLSIDSPVSPWTSVVPLVFVILVTAMKQGYEDWLRHRADREVNCSLVTVVRHGIAQEVESQEVCVGDLVRVACDADVPCDIVLLASSEQDGKCYVTTANLDGETNLKTLLCPRILKSYSLPEQLTSLRAQVECEQPTPDLYKFFGKLEILVEPPDKGRESWGGTLRRHWNSFRSSVSTSNRRKTTPATFIGVNGVVAAYDNDLTGAPKGAANEDRSHISVNVNDAFVPQPNGTGRDQDDPGPMKALPSKSLSFNDADVEYRRKGPLGEVNQVSMTSDGVFRVKFAENRVRIGSGEGVGDSEVPRNTSYSDDDCRVSSTGSVRSKRSSAGLNRETLSDRSSVSSSVLDHVDTSAPIGTENLLLRGARLKNTEFVFGCAVYTGQETKLALNSRLTSNKFSTVEKSINGFLLFFMGLLLVEVALCLGLKYYTELQGVFIAAEYLGPVPVINFRNVLQDLLSFFILFNYIIPISLYVTIEMQKFLGTLFFEWDEGLFCEETGQAAICNTSDLNEELGQVEYLFTDKTGTLTENNMCFRRCSVSGVPYLESEGRLFKLPSSGEDVRGTLVDTITEEMEKFLLGLALCHTVQLSNASKRLTMNNNLTEGDLLSMHLDYQASSPDEKALVEAAARKRMSLVVRDGDGDIWLYCKGAESSVIPLTEKGPTEKTLAHLGEFALRGLRTMVVGYRKLSISQYSSFSRQVGQARQTMSSHRESIIAASYSKMEAGLTLLGATGVEDKLQEGVQETLESLRAAGLKVWILTGDKVETAVNISFSCGHFKPGTIQLFLTEHHKERSCVQMLQAYSARVEADSLEQYGLVVDGQSLKFALKNQEMFRKVCMACTAVICCRMSPLQKSQVVQLVKQSPNKPITAAIGDGANDVAMIQEAHVGLGIMGKEGRQAVRCSDFAFGQFRFVRRVLLVHGHWYYLRISTLVLYFFYKNIVFITPQLFFNFLNAFSTQAIYDTAYLSMYNVLFTSLPILIYGLFEQNYSDVKLLECPHLYKEIANNVLMSWCSFLKWIAFGVWHTTVIFYIPYFLMMINEVILLDNTPIDQWMFGSIIYHCVVTIVNLKVLTHLYKDGD
uniref:Phospholipid-transporting ATPase n=1 Tax=Timema tahoe TaxID=61484 RepID=A0A7R9NYV6_9NEOP|nr:unnamed protein product [Timema tahoe]